MSELVKLYNPANAAALTPEQIEGLQKLTTDQIRELAKAYPNSSMTRAYLLIVDGTKEAHKQLPSLSTFENLLNLRTKNGLEKYVAFNFQGRYKPTAIIPSKARKTEVLDLSDTELKTLPGFKTKNENFEAQTVNVTKIKPNA